MHHGWIQILSKIFTLQPQCALFSQKDVFRTDWTVSTDDDLLNNEYWSLVEDGHGKRPLAGGDSPITCPAQFKPSVYVSRDQNKHTKLIQSCRAVFSQAELSSRFDMVWYSVSSHQGTVLVLPTLWPNQSRATRTSLHWYPFRWCDRMPPIPVSEPTQLQLERCNPYTPVLAIIPALVQQPEHPKQW